MDKRRYKICVTISLGGTWNEETQENTSIKHNEGIQPLELMDDVYWMTFNTNDKETQGLINSKLNEEITGQLNKWN